MNKVAKLIVLAGMTFVLACGTKGPDEAALEQARQDSITAAAAVVAPVEAVVEGAAATVVGAADATAKAGEAVATGAKDAVAKGADAAAGAAKEAVTKAAEGVKKAAH